MPLGTEVGLGLCDIVLDRDPVFSSPLKGHSPQFSANVRCGQTAGWMKTPLGTEVNLGPGHIVLDGLPALHERGTAAPPFEPMSVVATVVHLRYCGALIRYWRQVIFTRCLTYACKITRDCIGLPSGLALNLSVLHAAYSRSACSETQLSLYTTFPAL